VPATALTSLRRRAHRGAWVWLLALAAWLPLAQTAGALHALSHTLQAAPAVDTHEAQQDHSHVAACALCLAGHAVGDAAPAPVAARLDEIAQARDADARVAAQPPALKLALPYRSRAPPIAPLS
jgi:hypothetical protein